MATDDLGATASEPDAPLAPVSDNDSTPAEVVYSVNRSQDGAEVRAQLSLDDAQTECNILNAQARTAVGQTTDGTAIYGSMFMGEVSQYEVRSSDGLVVAS